MRFFYTIGIRIYYVIAFVYSIFNQKANLWVKGRKHLFTKIQDNIKGANNIYWFHVSSLGEFEQGRPIMEELKKQDPNLKILLTFFSPSGYEIRKNYTGADFIFYLPLDTRKNAKRFIKMVNPLAAVFIKYEFWYHYLHALYQNQIPIYLVSAIFRPKQAFFKWYGKWFRKMLRFYSIIYVQDEQSKKLLSSVKIPQVEVAGDTRFDRVASIASQAKSIPLVEVFTKGKPVFIGGSTWPKDEEILAKFMNQSQYDWKFIFAPHEIDKVHIQKLETLINKPVIRFSEAKEDTASNANVLIIDNIGMLSSLYKYARIAYIGGGFGAGIHNILEAAVFGVPVIFGPNYHKFKEARELIDVKGAFSINSYDECSALINILISDQKLRDQAASNAAGYVKKNTGATAKVLAKLTSK